MSVGSEVKLVDSSLESEEAFELEEHEFTLDPDDAALIAASQLPQRRVAPPPPPPSRRAAPVHTGATATRGAGAGAWSYASAPRTRHGSGVFSRPDPIGVDAESGEVARLRAQLRARDAYLAELERALDERTRQLSLAGIQNMNDVARIIGQLRGQAFRIAELESEARNAGLYAAELRAAARSGEPSSPGQLQRVRGIGPRYATQLAAIGVERLAQVAAWTEADVARVATHLHITASRIAREGWIDQARALQGSTAALELDA
jgi:predicted flap endonuclease-1-like 5' DNA nuclease